MNLPLEVRRQIYQVLVSNMCKDRVNTNGMNCVNLSVWLPEKKPTNYADYPPKPEGVEDTILKKFRLRHRDFNSPKRAKHSGRNYNYDLSTGFGSSFQVRDDIRNLSNVNSIIRKELAEVAFARTSINLCNVNATVFGYMLSDRPALWVGIKYLRLGLSFLGSNPSLSEFEQPANFLEMLNLSSTILRLEHLQVTFRINEQTLDLFVRKDTQTTWISALRKVPVAHSFELIFNPLPRNEDDEDKINSLRIRYERLVKEKIFPDSLRPKSLDSMTEVERYMATRV